MAAMTNFDIRIRVMELMIRIGRLTRPLESNSPIHGNELEDIEQAARDAKEVSTLLNCFVNNEVVEKIPGVPYDLARYGPL